MWSKTLLALYDRWWFRHPMLPCKFWHVDFRSSLCVCVCVLFGRFTIDQLQPIYIHTDTPFPIDNITLENWLLIDWTLGRTNNVSNMRWLNATSVRFDDRYSCFFSSLSPTFRHIFNKQINPSFSSARPSSRTLRRFDRLRSSDQFQCDPNSAIIFLTWLHLAVCFANRSIC